MVCTCVYARGCVCVCRAGVYELVREIARTDWLLLSVDEAVGTYHEALGIEKHKSWYVC